MSNSPIRASTQESSRSSEAEPERAHTGPKRNAARHQAILEATVEILGRKGYHGLTIEEVASSARVGKQTIYRWWPSKAPLVLEALLQRLNVDVAPASDNLREDLVRAVKGTISNFTQQVAGTAITALAAELSHDPELMDSFRADFLRPRRHHAGASIRRAIAHGRFPSDADIELVMDIFAGTVFYRALMSGEPVDDWLAEQLVDLLLEGKIPRLGPRRHDHVGAAVSAGPPTEG